MAGRRGFLCAQGMAAVLSRRDIRVDHRDILLHVVWLVVHLRFHPDNDLFLPRVHRDEEKHISELLGRSHRQECEEHTHHTGDICRLLIHLRLSIDESGKPVRLDKFIFFIGMLGLILLIVRSRKSSSKDWMFITGSALWYLVLLSDKMLAVGPVTYSVFISIPVLIGIALSLRSGVENDSGSEDEERFSSLNYAVILFI